MARWRIDILRKRAEPLGTIEAASEREAIEKAAKELTAHPNAGTGWSRIRPPCSAACSRSRSWRGFGNVKGAHNNTAWRHRIASYRFSSFSIRRSTIARSLAAQVADNCQLQSSTPALAAL